MSNPTWQNRWKITAKLTTKTPLHIGGDLPRQRTIYPFADQAKGKKQEVLVTSVVTDCNNKPYLPGSTIKGNIRAWMTERDYSHIENIFGSEHTKTTDQVGGKVEFCDAFWDQSVPPFTENPPYWEQDRLTGITASAAIDRETGTTSDGKLFHLEYVPPGVSFTLQITGQDLDNDEVGALLHALSSGFKDAESPIALGASSANDWGRFKCSILSVEQLDAKAVAKWLDEPQAAGYEIPMRSVPKWKKMVKAPPSKSPAKYLKVGLEMQFDGPFLVNDKSKSKDVRDDKHDADMNPRCDTDGNAILPAASFRGAFRSQAERILRTMGGAACTPKNPCPAIGKISEESGLCLACQFFGASGWKTLVEVPQFSLKAGSGTFFPQEFVAIDRFTGGAKGGAKFNAASVLDPVFTGTLKIDLRRIKPWAFGLLALTLKDLCEGDITFGFGAAKGYGTCRANILSTEGHEDFEELPDSWQRLSPYVEELEKAIAEEISKGGTAHDQIS